MPPCHRGLDMLVLTFLILTEINTTFTIKVFTMFHLKSTLYHGVPLGKGRVPPCEVLSSGAHTFVPSLR